VAQDPAAFDITSVDEQRHCGSFRTERMIDTVRSQSDFSAASCRAAGRAILSAALAVVCALPAASQPNARGMFVFQNNFWVNLHQFLRGEIYRRRVNAALGLDPAALNDVDRAAWASALDVYAGISKQDLIFDPDARRIDNTLAMAEDAERLSDGLLDASTTAALNAAAPIYRARLWSARQRDNEAWNAQAKALIDRHETAMASALASVYHIAWPRERYLVDAVGEIGPNSAVTHVGPIGFAAHIQAGAASPRNTGDAPLELLFHEASHAASVEGAIRAMIDDECRRQNLAVSPNLWHLMIMYTSGAVARRELANTGHPSYQPYIDRYDQLPPGERSAFERDWQPYLDRKAPFEQALHDLVRDAR
jgi:hypothetical protein